MHKNSQLDADQSAVMLTVRILHDKPFLFVRYGDGALECMGGYKLDLHKNCHVKNVAATCDGEIYTAELGADLLRCWRLFIDHPNTIIGDWLSASFDAKSIDQRYEHQYQELVGDAKPIWAHFEALLLMRRTEALRSFYWTIANTRKRKLLMGPEQWRKAARMLHTDFMPVPFSDSLHKLHRHEIRTELFKREFDILLYGAGMAGNIPVIDHWSEHTDKTYISLGSALDPLYRGQTRQQQISTVQAHNFLSNL